MIDGRKSPLLDLINVSARGFTPLWTASTVRILELVLLKFGDFAFGERVVVNLTNPCSMSEKFDEKDDFFNSPSTYDRSGRAREDPRKMSYSRIFP